ncbi:MULTISPECIES: hypothetical protein [Paenibacillus]|uniref:hypothetical protein n=1 Tax=Paenibacillus TaxID=44249 RepID=UPI0004F814E3|nr:MULTISPECIES: hypothetical protein [unclassified Paenibacillus]AIQ27926.1 hypothetical protein P40081_06815 [Paenibacillus sp. FSL P4-0081]OMF32818.1 hypothetical protein BK132_00790 [Paenibacillus sp. FSL H8-0259]
MTDVEHAFNKFLSIRMEYIGSSILSNSDDYKHLIYECNQLFVELISLLPQDCQLRLQHYETSTVLLQSISETLMYKQGLKDGMNLNTLLPNESPQNNLQ